MSRRAPLALLLALTVSSAACGHASPGHRVVMATAGFGLVVTAAAVASTDDSHTDWGGDHGSSDTGGSSDSCEAACTAGLLMVGTGIVVGVIALMSGTGYSKKPAPPATPVIDPIATDGPPGGEGVIDAAPPLTRKHVPLPELSTDARTLQLAKQARSAALAGNCDAASLTLATIRERDARYHAALVRSLGITGCR